MRKKVLVTGSSGMLGTDLSLVFGRSYDVIGADLAKSRTSAYRRRRFMRCDVTNRKKAVSAVKKSEADIVLHAAAWTDVDGCELDKEKAMAVNSEGARNIALGCKETGAVMFYISSDFVFDGAKEASYVEDDAPNPLNAYGLSKLKGEEAVRNECERYFIVRTSWLFGKNGKNFVDIILDKADRRQALKVVMDQFGSPTFTKDLAKALEGMASMALKNKRLRGVYHFCNGGNCSWYKYAEEILRAAGKSETPILPMTSLELDRPAARPGMSILNTDKYSQLCGKRPRAWQAALRDYLVNDLPMSGRDYVQSFKKKN